MIRIFEKVSSPQAVFLELPDMIEVGRRLQLGALSPHPSHLLLCSLLLCYLLFFLEKKKKGMKVDHLGELTWVEVAGRAGCGRGDLSARRELVTSPTPPSALFFTTSLFPFVWGY